MILGFEGKKEDVNAQSQLMKARRVLLIEDDAMLAMFLSEALIDLGHGVCAIAASESQAMAAAARCQPDLLIADVNLGRDSGISAVTEILRTQFIPYLFMSGNVAPVKALLPDAVTLQKPFKEPDLDAAIKRAMRAVPA